jgi:cyclopropane fatty-acyl-phospholipid synthase-like methyltransferase
MSTPHSSLPPSYFEQLYAENPDPWGFATSPYEQAKYAATLTALPKAHYRTCLEVGCSIGVLTAQLATRCDALLAIDVSTAALEQARARCADLPHVRFAQRQVPHAFPPGNWELIVVSEVGYYLSWHDLTRFQQQVLAALDEGGDVVLVHWTGATDYPLTGDEVHESFSQLTGLHHRTAQRHPQYRLDVFTRS